MNDTRPSRSADAPSLETVHALLKNRRRRFVVDVLAGRQAPIDLRVLARAITMRLPAPEGENAEAVDDMDAVDDADATTEASADLDRMATALHHVDLPRLAKADVVEYDPEANVVTPTDVERIAPFLDAADSLR